MRMLRSTTRAARVRTARVVAVFALFVASPAVAQDAPARGAITVDEAVRRALAANHDLLAARENIEAASGRKNQALQRYMPSIFAGMDFQRTLDDSLFVAPGVKVGVTNKNSYGINYGLSQTLIDWSAFKSIQAASRNLDASKFDYEQARADLVLLAKQQYYTLLRAQLLAEVADSALLVSQQDLRRVQSLFDLGMVARGDVLKAQVRQSQSQLEVISTRNVVVLERSRLAALMGQEPNDDLAATRDVTPAPANVDSAAVFNEALANRSDLKAAEAALAASNASVGAAKAGYYPTLNGTIRYRHDSDKEFDVTEESRTRTGALSLDIPIFSSIWGTKGAIQQTRAARNQASYALDRLRLDVQVEVRDAVSTARQANEGLIVAQEQMTSAEEDLKLSQEKYNVGSGTILELIDAQVALVRARSNYIQALTQVRVAEAAIERVRGRTY